MRKNLFSILKLTVSIMILVLCFFRNQIFKPETEMGKNTLTVLTFVAIVVFGRLIFSSITELIDSCDNPDKNKDERGVLKEWTKEELYVFLEKEDMIDMVVKYEDKTYKIGAEADVQYPKYGKPYVAEKGYYIEEKEYDSIEEFKKDFEILYKTDTVLITYFGIEDMPITI